MSSLDRILEDALRIGLKQVQLPALQDPSVQAVIASAIREGAKVAVDQVVNNAVSDVVEQAKEGDGLRDRLGMALMLLTATRAACPYVGEFLDQEENREELVNYVTRKQNRGKEDRSDSTGQPGT